MPRYRDAGRDLLSLLSFQADLNDFAKALEAESMNALELEEASWELCYDLELLLEPALQAGPVILSEKLGNALLSKIGLDCWLRSEQVMTEKMISERASRWFDPRRKAAIYRLNKVLADETAAFKRLVEGGRSQVILRAAPPSASPESLARSNTARMSPRRSRKARSNSPRRASARRR
jgi:hypothetical protein